MSADKHVAFPLRPKARAFRNLVDSGLCIPYEASRLAFGRETTGKSQLRTNYLEASLLIKLQSTKLSQYDGGSMCGTPSFTAGDTDTQS